MVKPFKKQLIELYLSRNFVYTKFMFSKCLSRSSVQQFTFVGIFHYKYTKSSVGNCQLITRCISFKVTSF